MLGSRSNLIPASFFLALVIFASLPAQASADSGCPITTNPYNTSWLSINFTVIMISFAVIAVVYILSNLMPTASSAKIKALVVTELNQNLISVIIIVILLGATITVSEFSATIGSTGAYACNPFASADFYVGNLTFNTGLKMLNNIYSTSITYAIDSRLYSGVGQSVYSSVITPNVASFISKTFLNFGLFSVTPIFAGDLGMPYAIMSDLLTIVFTPIMMLAMGAMFIQYLLIPLIQGSAFFVVLPIALIMRSFAFTGAGLRTAANSVLAIAIAAYLIYPTMVAYNPTMLSWIFTPCSKSTWCNPGWSYLDSAYSLPNIQESSFFTSTGGSTPTSVQMSGLSITSLSFGEFTQILSSAIDPALVVSNVLNIANEVAMFLFTSIVLFALDLMVMMGFAVGLAKALNGGLDGASSFWSNV